MVIFRMRIGSFDGQERLMAVGGVSNPALFGSIKGAAARAVPSPQHTEHPLDKATTEKTGNKWKLS